MGCIKINRRLLFLGKVSRQAYALRVTGLGFYGIWGFCKHRVFIMVWPDLKKKESEVQIMRNEITLTSSIWVGSRSVSIMCPMLSSPPRIYLDAEWFKLVHQKTPWWLLWWLSVCFFKWSLREKLFPQRPHLCFLSPVWILKCLCNSSDLNKRNFRKKMKFSEEYPDLVNLLTQPGQLQR